jgi:hypothetical protein
MPALTKGPPDSPFDPSERTLWQAPTRSRPGVSHQPARFGFTSVLQLGTLHCMWALGTVRQGDVKAVVPR